MKLFKKKPEIVKVGIWGPPGSGKTAFLVMLRSSDLNGWRIRTSPKGGNLLVMGLQSMRKLKNPEFLPATPEGRASIKSLEFEGPAGFLGQNKSFQVEIPEASGELFANPNSDEAIELANELGKYHGLLWLIDPEKVGSSFSTESGEKLYQTMIDEWLGILYEQQGGGELEMYTAFCLTKMDLPGHSEHFDDPENYCYELLGEDFEMFLNNNCNPNRVGFFATSSIGFHGNKKESNRDPNDSTRLLSPAKPINLFDPFEWLFNEI